MAKFSTRYLILSIIILLSIVGGVIAIYASANGPWGYTDPVQYISVARSLDRGQGLTYYEGNGKLTPDFIHPPLYSLVLSLFGLFGANLVAASRWLNVCAFIASIFIAGWIFYRYSRVPALGIIASALMCAFPNMLIMFASSYSEPLFVLSILAGGLMPVGLFAKGKIVSVDHKRFGGWDDPRDSLCWNCHGGRGGIDRPVIRLGKDMVAPQESRTVYIGSRFTCIDLAGVGLFFIFPQRGRADPGVQLEGLSAQLPGIPRNFYGHCLEMGPVPIPRNPFGLSAAFYTDGCYCDRAPGAFVSWQNAGIKRMPWKAITIGHTDLYLLWLVGR